LLETQELPLARATLAQAEQCLAQAPDDRSLAITRVNQAAVELQQGHLEAAEARYRQALALFGESDPSSLALCHARRGAVAALAGDLDRARGHHARAAALAPLQDPLTLRLLELWRVFLEWQAQDRASALARRRQALSSADGPSLIQVSDEARLVLRLLEPLATRPEQGVVVGPAGAWFRLPSQEPVQVHGFAAIARILAHLAHRAEEQPGSVSDADALIEAGWPGEQIQYEASRNRLAVSLSKLRKLGLKAQLQRTKDGWRLDPDWSVLLLRED
jgi:tetratricopeptide (TPR) repeat protein